MAISCSASSRISGSVRSVSAAARSALVRVSSASVVAIGASCANSREYVRNLSVSEAILGSREQAFEFFMALGECFQFTTQGRFHRFSQSLSEGWGGGSRVSLERVVLLHELARCCWRVRLRAVRQLEGVTGGLSGHGQVVPGLLRRDGRLLVVAVRVSA